MYSDALLAHFRDPQNVGTLPPPAFSTTCVNPACGDTLTLSVLWDKSNRATEVRYQVRGCTAAIAAGSALTLLLLGKSRADFSQVTTDEIEAAVGGLTNESRHAAQLCRDAARQIAAIWTT